MKLWLIRATTTVLLWTYFIQLTALGGSWDIFCRLDREIEKRDREKRGIDSFNRDREIEKRDRERRGINSCDSAL
ncbi:hypothetical protein L1887_03024 [Cichorium endivia]|nr:hypothetical protein L1887_03024 [Cichorium endivia]